MPQYEVDEAGNAPATRILVVEDEPVIRFVMAEALRELGATVLEASSADEAWQLLHAVQVDLVFTDYRMPGSMNGGQLADRTIQLYPHVKVVITSGNVGDNNPNWTEPLVRKPYEVYAVAADLIRRARDEPSSEHA